MILVNYTITTNKIQCIKCLAILESEHVHDFKSCFCPKGQQVAVDGGREYLKRSYHDSCEANIHELSIVLVDREKDPISLSEYIQRIGFLK